MAMSLSRMSGSLKPIGQIKIPDKYKKQLPGVTGVPGRAVAAPKQPDYAAEAINAANTARASAEAGKQSALGYFGGIQSGLSQMSPELISSGEQAQMENVRREQLGAYGQNLASQYGDSSAGVQSGIRRQIGMGIAGRQANIPIETALQVKEANRTAALGLYGAQAGIAGQMGAIQTAYQYDPGLEYIKSLGQSAGYMGTAAPAPAPSLLSQLQQQGLTQLDTMRGQVQSGTTQLGGGGTGAYMGAGVAPELKQKVKLAGKRGAGFSTRTYL